MTHGSRDHPSPASTPQVLLVRRARVVSDRSGMSANCTVCLIPSMHAEADPFGRCLKCANEARRNATYEVSE